MAFEYVAAYLLTSSCTLEVWATVYDDMKPQLIAEVEFADRDLCDQLVAWGVRTIQLQPVDYGRQLDAGVILWSDRSEATGTRT